MHLLPIAVILVTVLLVMNCIESMPVDQQATTFDSLNDTNATFNLMLKEQGTVRSDDSSPPIAIYIGGGVGGSVGLVILLCIIFCCCC